MRPCRADTSPAPEPGLPACTACRSGSCCCCCCCRGNAESSGSRHGAGRWFSVSRGDVGRRPARRRARPVPAHPAGPAPALVLAPAPPRTVPRTSCSLSSTESVEVWESWLYESCEPAAAGGRRLAPGAVAAAGTAGPPVDWPWLAGNSPVRANAALRESAASAAARTGRTEAPAAAATPPAGAAGAVAAWGALSTMCAAHAASGAPAAVAALGALPARPLSPAADPAAAPAFRTCRSPPRTPAGAAASRGETGTGAGIGFVTGMPESPPVARALLARSCERTCRTPHALQSVLGPAGPSRHCGVLVAPHSRHTRPVAFRLGTCCCPAVPTPLPPPLPQPPSPPTLVLRGPMFASGGSARPADTARGGSAARTLAGSALCLSASGSGSAASSDSVNGLNAFVSWMK
eukprot:134875-Chlamydomonas_euryale.AAC.2